MQGQTRAPATPTRLSVCGGWLTITLPWAGTPRRSALREETLALRKAELGPKHPKTLESMSDLADSYDALGRHADALELYEETLKLEKAAARRRSSRYAADHERAGGRSFYALERHAEALKLREQTLALSQGQARPRPPRHALDARDAWLESLAAVHRGDEAVPLIDECVQHATGKAVDPNLLPRIIKPAPAALLRQAKDAAGCRQTAEMWESLKRTDLGSLDPDRQFPSGRGGGSARG